MIEIMLFTLIIGLIGFIGGWYAREWYAKRVVHMLEQRLGRMAEEMKKRAVEVRVEQQGDTFFVYNANTGEFLAQGDSHEAITKTLNDRFPNTFFTADRDELRKLGYKHDAV